MPPIVSESKEFQPHPSPGLESAPRRWSVLKPAASGLPRAPAAPSGAKVEELDVLLARSGRTDAFERLVARHRSAVLRVTLSALGQREDAEDAAQETFLKAYLHLRGFRGGSSFRTWILRIALNTARSLRARERARKRCPRDGARVRFTRAAPEIPGPRLAGSPEAALEARDLASALAGALGELDGDARGLLLSRVLGDQPYQAIAAARGLPVGTVKSRIHRARLELRARVASYL
jgi:RNA polymerase sigma-70 factor (ECF subfamily)